MKSNTYISISLWHAYFYWLHLFFKKLPLYFAPLYSLLFVITCRQLSGNSMISFEWIYTGFWVKNLFTKLFDLVFITECCLHQSVYAAIAKCNWLFESQRNMVDRVKQTNQIQKVFRFYFCCMLPCVVIKENNISLLINSVQY